MRKDDGDEDLPALWVRPQPPEGSRWVNGWTRDELTDELAAGTGAGEAIWRDLLADAPREDLANILAEADRLRAEGKELA